MGGLVMGGGVGRGRRDDGFVAGVVMKMMIRRAASL